MINSKRKIWYRFILILTMIALVFTFAGCGSDSAGTTQDNNYDGFKESIDEGETARPSEPSGGNGDSGFAGSNSGSQSNNYDYANEQKIIYNGNININVNDIEQATTNIEQVVKGAGGFLLNSTRTENDNRFFVSYQFKIPVDGLHSVMEEIEALELGMVTYNNIDGRDVTEEYQDISSRLKAKRVYEERLLDLFAQADKTEDLLRIANDLSKVQEEIESLEGRKNYLAYHADNSTLSVELYQYKDQVSPAASSWTKAIEGLKITIQKIGNGLVNFFIWLVSYLPIILIIGLIGATTWFLLRKRNKKRREISEQVEQELLNNDKDK